MRKVILLSLVILLCALGVESVLAGEPTPSASPPPTELAITSISVDGTNLSIVAAIPAGLDQVALEISASLNGDWQEAGPVEVPKGTKHLTIELPKPATPMAFFRLKAKRHLEAA